MKKLVFALVVLLCSPVFAQWEVPVVGSPQAAIDASFDLTGLSAAPVVDDALDPPGFRLPASETFICLNYYSYKYYTSMGEANWDSCKKLLVRDIGGAVTSRVNGDWNTGAEAYFSGSIYWGWVVDSIKTSADGLYVYVGTANSYVVNEPDVGTWLTYLDLSIIEYASTDCSGNETGRSWTDMQDCVWTINVADEDCTRGNIAQQAWGIGDCDSDELAINGDPDPQESCHMPDVLITPNTWTQDTYRSYKYTIQDQMLDYYGSMSSSWGSSTGCIVIHWIV
jgi:hypothetical protein